MNSQSYLHKKFQNFEAHIGIPVIHTFYFKPWYGKPERQRDITSLLITYKKSATGEEFPQLIERENNNEQGWGMPYSYNFKEDELYIIILGVCRENSTQKTTILCSPLANFKVIDNDKHSTYEMIGHSQYFNAGLIIEIKDSCINIQSPWFEQSKDIIRCELNDKIELEAIRLYIKILENGYFHAPTTNEVAVKLDQIFQYIDGIDINKVFNTYFIEKSGQYVRRVGRDDHYHYQVHKSLDTTDEYLKSLFDLKDEDDYYACNSQGEEEADIKNEPQYNSIKWAIVDAHRKYTKTRHIAYYIQQTFADFEKRKIRYSNLKKSLQKLYSQNRVSNLFSDMVKDRYFGYGIDLQKINNYIQQKFTEKSTNKDL